jgi:hypothetical protein
LADPLEDLVAELGGDEDEEEVGEDPGDVAGRGYREDERLDRLRLCPKRRRVLS